MITARVIRRHMLFFVLLVMVPAAAWANTAAQVVVADTADGGGMGGGTFFMVTAVDGVPVRENALSASAAASVGRGANMIVRGAERAVPAGKVTLDLRGTQTHVAPIDTLFRSVFRGGNPVVSGIVTVELVAGQMYRVNGVINAFKREVWLEDGQGKVVSDSKIVAEPNPELVKQMEGSVYVATNLRYEGDWISEAPWPHLDFVPVGSRLKVLDYGSNRATVLIDGRKMRMGIDHSRGKETIQQFVARATVAEDPMQAIAAYPQDVRNAIRAGRVLIGMSRDQVRLALGRPRVDLVPALDASEWLYQTEDAGDLFLVFDQAGLLKEVDGARKVRKLVLYESQ